MKFNKILDSNSQEFKDVWKIYTSSFPPDEKRCLNRQIELFDDKLYNLFVVYEENQLVGFIATWDFSDFIFIEHFAVEENLRSKGLGTKLLKEYIIQANKNIVLEVERPKTTLTKKRIEFYEKLGFKLNLYDYIQPAYGQEKKSIPLFLMTFPEKINGPEFIKIREQLHKTVYGVKS